MESLPQLDLVPLIPFGSPYNNSKPPPVLVGRLGETLPTERVPGHRAADDADTRLARP